MKIFSCIKPVPDPASRLVINESKTWIKDHDLTFVASEADNYALEEALRLKEKDGGADLILAGVQSDDLGTGMTGVMLAEFIGFAHATVVIGVEANADAKT